VGNEGTVDRRTMHRQRVRLPVVIVYGHHVGRRSIGLRQY
jgi:hypothetical protein